MFRRAGALLSFVVLSTVSLASAPASGAVTGDPSVGAKAWVLVDADSGSVLAAYAHHQPLPPASTTKVMTALMAVEGLPPDSSFVVSPTAAAQPAMRIGMKAGQPWTRTQALHSLMMVSANDAAYALGEAVSGSLAAFAADTNAAAARYGMKDSTFNDPAGFDDAASFNGGSLVSAYDLAVAARNYLAVPELAAIAPMLEYSFTGPARDHTLYNHNKLLRRYEGAIGLKTGYTRRAGHTFVGAATRGGRTMIAVVLDADDIYAATASLLDRGFATPAEAVGTGERLPPVRVKLWEPPVEVAIAAAQREAADPTGAAAGGGWLRRIATSLVVVAASTLVLRRRAVVRRRTAAQRRRVVAQSRARERLGAVDPGGWPVASRATPETPGVAPTDLRQFESI